jgi:hypothetical protein
MEAFTLGNVQDLLIKLQEENRELRDLANRQAVGIDRALLRLEMLIKQNPPLSE